METGVLFPLLKTKDAFHSAKNTCGIFENFQWAIGPLQDPVTWFGINYAGTQMTQWDFQNKGTRTSPADFPLFWKSHCAICVPA